MRHVDRKRAEFILRQLGRLETKSPRILDVGAGDLWLTKLLRARGYNVTSLDLSGRADIIADFNTHNFKTSFDAIIAVEVVEHGLGLEKVFALLKPGGIFIATTIYPYFDFPCKILEAIGLAKPRKTAHTNLLYLKSLPYKLVDFEDYFMMDQFGAFGKG
ncbi:MAG: methyltransferase domain-containing protein [Candidatus Diapherotrites archaeon]